MPRTPIYSEAEILSARDSLISPGREPDPWEVFVALGQKGKFKRVQEILAANPPKADEDAPPRPDLGWVRMPDETREQIGQIGADFAQRAIEVITAAVGAAKREHEAHETALREAHQAQLRAAAMDLKKAEERASEQSRLICALETALEEIESQCVDLRAERDRLAADLASLSAEQERLATVGQRLAGERDAAIADLEPVRSERNRLAAENARLTAELERVSAPGDATKADPVESRGTRAKPSPKPGSTSKNGTSGSAARADGSKRSREKTSAEAATYAASDEDGAMPGNG